MSTTVEQLLASKGHDFYFVRPDASVQHAAESLTELNVGALLVCESERLIGIISERDCVRRVMARGKNPASTLVREVMTHNPIVVAPSDTIDRCMQIMTDMRIRHLPVVRYARVLGVVTLGDSVHSVVSERDHLIEDLEGYIAGPASVVPPAS